MLIPRDSLDSQAERRRRCCDDERELLLEMAERALAEERAARSRQRIRLARRLVTAVFGWPYPARRRRAARRMAAGWR